MGAVAGMFPDRFAIVPQRDGFTGRAAVVEFRLFHILRERLACDGLGRPEVDDADVADGNLIGVAIFHRRGGVTPSKGETGEGCKLFFWLPLGFTLPRQTLSLGLGLLGYKANRPRRDARARARDGAR